MISFAGLVKARLPFSVKTPKPMRLRGDDFVSYIISL